MSYFFVSKEELKAVGIFHELLNFFFRANEGFLNEDSSSIQFLPLIWVSSLVTNELQLLESIFLSLLFNDDLICILALFTESIV